MAPCGGHIKYGPHRCHIFFYEVKITYPGIYRAKKKGLQPQESEEGSLVDVTLGPTHIFSNRAPTIVNGTADTAAVKP